MEEKKYVPASEETIANLRENMLKTADSCYKEMYVDMVLSEGLNRGLYDEIENQDKAYLDSLIRVHANVAYSHLCVCVQMRASLKATLNVEKQYNIRRCIVMAHEMYKYLYGFTGRNTPWLTIEERVRAQYDNECIEIDEAAARFLERYAQNEDGTLRNVAKHYSDNPVEFFENMEKVNELTRELASVLGIYYQVAMACPMPAQTFELTGLRKRDDLAVLDESIKKYSGIVKSVMAQIKAVRGLETQYQMDLSGNEQWKSLTEDNIGLHILYVYLDAVSAFRAFMGSESFAEIRQNLAYMILLSHEGFKKLYGFDETKRQVSYWHRAVKDFLAKNGGEELMEEVSRIESVMDRLADSDILKDEDMVVAYTHVETIKKRGIESSFAVLDYFRQPITPMDMEPLLEFLKVMNDIVRLYSKVMGLESEKMKNDTNATLRDFMNKISLIDQMAEEHIDDPEQRAKWQETSAKMRGLLTSLMS